MKHGGFASSMPISFAAGAKPFILESSRAENLRVYCMFKALYVILNETDSHEYYLDGQGKLFKLDNAASFTVEKATILLFDGNPIERFLIPDVNAPLRAVRAVGYDYYGLRMQAFAESIGQYADDAYVSAIRRFASLNELALDEAYSAVDKQYPPDLKNYFAAAIRIRKNTCRRFLKSLGAGS